MNGLLDISKLTEHEKAMLYLNEAPNTLEEEVWLEANANSVLFDSAAWAAGRREREFCSPTFVAKTAEKYD